MIRIAGLAGLALLLATSAFAQQADQPLLTGKDAFGDWKADKPGVRRLIKPDDLQKPYLTKSASNSAGLGDRPEGAKPVLPPGFSAELIASGIANPRVMRVAPNGDLFVADSDANQIRVYRLAKGSAKPAEDGIFAGDLNQPYGIAFYPPGDKPQWVYVANTDSVVRYRLSRRRPESLRRTGDDCLQRPLRRPLDPRHRLLARRQDAVSLGRLRIERRRGHGEGAGWRHRSLDEVHAARRGLGRGGRPRRRAGLRPRRQEWPHLRHRPAQLLGHDRAAGDRRALVRRQRARRARRQRAVRICHPVKDGAFYGWPWYYIGDNEDPRHKGARPDLAGKVTVPDVLLQAHSAPLDIAFYDGEQLPGRVQGRRLRRAARLVEPRHAHRLQGGAAAVQATASRPANTRTS